MCHVGLMLLQFHLSYNSSVLNSWPNTSLVLAGVINAESTPPPVIHPPRGKISYNSSVLNSSILSSWPNTSLVLAGVINAESTPPPVIHPPRGKMIYNSWVLNSSVLNWSVLNSWPNNSLVLAGVINAQSNPHPVTVNMVIFAGGKFHFVRFYLPPGIYI